MRILILGAGGVGSAAALIAARRQFPSRVVVADYHLAKAERAVLATTDERFHAARVGASDQIEECLNPPVIYEKDRGWFTTEPFSEPEIFDFPEGIGPVECVNVEHEEVVLIPRWAKSSSTS